MTLTFDLWPMTVRWSRYMFMQNFIKLRVHRQKKLRQKQCRADSNRINLLYSSKIRSWSSRFRQFGVCQVNSALSSTLLHSYVLNKWAKFSTKIFTHFWDVVIFVLGYFISNHPIYCILSADFSLQFNINLQQNLVLKQFGHNNINSKVLLTQSYGPLAPLAESSLAFTKFSPIQWKKIHAVISI